jgi:hypothetical protein
MTSLIMIPQGVDLSKLHHVVKATSFKGAIEDWHNLSDNDYFEWQEFLLPHSTELEPKSNNWLDDVLHLFMEKTLRSEVKSDLNSIPKNQCGSITTLQCIIKRMVIRNQEAQDTLEMYIKTFNITNFSGKNVPTACLCLKAVAHALGDKDLPNNAIRKVLEGFAKLSTKLFNNFCASQIALCWGTFYRTLMKNTSLQNQLNDVLNDLETSYLDLVGGKLWEGVIASPTRSSFLANHTNNKEIEKAMAMAAMKKLPFDKWVKLHAICHHCGEKGHICPHCLKYIEQVKSGQIKIPPKQRPSPRGPYAACPPGLPAAQHPYMKDPKAKAFLSFFQALFTKEDKEEEDDTERNDDVDATDDNEDKEDMRNFLLMVGSLKE